MKFVFKYIPMYAELKEMLLENNLLRIFEFRKISNVCKIFVVSSHKYLLQINKDIK